MNTYLSRFVDSSGALHALLIVLGVAALLAVLAPTKVSDERYTPADSGRSIGVRESSISGRSESISQVRREVFSLPSLVDLFSSTSWVPPAPPVVPAKLTAPAFPFHYVGMLVDGGGQMQIYLAQQGSGVIFTPKSGDTLTGGFQVDAVSDDHISVTYLPLKEKLTISYSTLGSEPGVRQATFAASDSGVPVAAVADVSRGLGATGVASAAVSALPPIAGLAPIAASAQTTIAANGNIGTLAGLSSAGSSSTSSGASSPVSPGVALVGTILGSAPVASAAIGTAPSASGSIGTAPTSTNTSALYGPIPTSGGPAVK